MHDRIRDACTRRLIDAPKSTSIIGSGWSANFDAAQISTIHSFCGSLLRRTPSRPASIPASKSSTRPKPTRSSSS